MSTTFTPSDHLPDALLERIRSRAAQVDRDNVFPEHDLIELREAGYLRILVPEERGGAGLSLEQASVLQQRLATAAPATALAVNMHLVWTAVALILHNRGDDSLLFLQDEAARGEVFAFGISEPGNDLMLFGSDTQAAPTGDGGYAFTGTKIFTSLSPVWTRLGVHGLDSASEDRDMIVFAFIERSEAITARDDWDTIGMRGTQSRTTDLAGAVAAADRVVRRVDPGPGPDAMQFAIFAAFTLLIASVYTGLAERAIALAGEAARARISKKSGLTRAEDPVVRSRVGAMVITHDALPLQLSALSRDIDAGVDHGARWFSLLSGMKDRAVTAAQKVVDDAVIVAGGGAFRNGSELARLSRDVRAGIFHPTSPDAARQTAAASVLG
ncbi:acyl-CoA dehydrogenase family protein [Microbacterium amylolyticum]|uniref:Alkylation response protein AidB-like acyl-CoA dehydrogenase n=1 Tax=Microbacterium amylolyticum TaxID=936337 RepID=A0ABS4ZHY4_9MICO|nr:acyl-CoA dehydrogenase family protein [Microbacterium amylolyticum]MBP2436889.1 alkylation response protein AidB-like acyl-CoA dehydrogenase [Microbacterium amylolyticum]